MEIYYFQAKYGNFGDDLNPWLWPKLIPELDLAADGSYLIGIGSILNQKINLRLGDACEKHVFGSGFAYGELPKLDSSWNIHFVRGPLTADKLGIDRRCAITDSAILLRSLKLDSVKRENLIGFMPHQKSCRFADWEAICTDVDFTYIDPTAPVEQTLYLLRKCRFVITEAMHGAIVADAFRVPWVPIQCYKHITHFKWQDWCESANLAYRPSRIPEIWYPDYYLTRFKRSKNHLKRFLLRAGIIRESWHTPPPARSTGHVYDEVKESLVKLARQAEPVLSSDKKLDQLTSRCEEKLWELKSNLR